MKRHPHKIDLHNGRVLRFSHRIDRLFARVAARLTNEQFAELCNTLLETLPEQIEIEEAWERTDDTTEEYN